MPEHKEWNVPYEKPGPPKGEAYGITSVTQALEGLDFPASKRDLLSKAGNKTIHWTKDHPMKLRDILDNVPDEDFPSMANVVSAISDAMHGESKREAA